MGKFIMNGVPYGGGDVEANPSGTATDTLTKLGIEGTVYEIQGGGGGSSGSAYREVVLWNNPTSTASWSNPVTMTLNDDITNYHELKVVFSNQSGNTYGYITIPVSEVLAHNYTQYFSNDAIGGASNYVLVNAINEITGYPKDTGTTTYYVKVIGIKYGGNLSPIIYSTEEREVGVWIDNKPLYQRTYKYSGEYTSDNVLQMQGLSDTEHIIIVNSQCEDIGGHILFLPYANATANYVRSYYLTPQDNTFNLLCNSNSPIKNPTITLQYTKTTDTAGSGSYNTLGIPNIHYDGNEKVIGTWFGETLYEKTLVIHNESIVNSDTTITTIDSTFRVKNWKAFAIENGVTYKVPYVAGSGNASFFFRENGNVEFTIRNTSFAAGSDFYITIQYTKTT